MFQSLSLTYSLKSSALISSEYPSPLSTLKDSKLRQPTIILLVLLLTIIFNQPTTVHSSE